MTTRHAAGTMASCLLAIATHVQATTIYFDTFTGNDGDLIEGRAPETNNGVADATYEGPTTIWPCDIEGNRARLGADTYANIDIASAGGFVQPPFLRISAIMDIGSTGGPSTPDGTEPTRGLGLGFYAGVGDNIFVDTDFRGLVLTTDGRLVLGRTGENGSPRVGTVETIVSGLDNAGQHTLSFEIDTGSGDISNILLDGNLQPDVSTTLFNAEVNRAGFFASSSAGGTSAYIDDFTVEGVVPEPTSLALLCLGGLVIARRRR